MRALALIPCCVTIIVAADPALAQTETPPQDQLVLPDQPPAREPLEFYSLAEDEAYYIRFSGLITEPQNDGRSLDSGEPIGFDTGGGVSLGIGYTFYDAPVAIELEWTYREFDVESVGSLSADGDISLNTIAANLLLDQANIIGPVGAYAGLGAGVRINQFKFSSSSGQSELKVDGDGFYWQAMAGLTVSLGERTQLFGGVRWSDAGTIDDNDLSVDTETLDYEIGIRLFF
jgi:opacity protein-like surface antigen